MCLETLEHVENPRQVLRSIRSVLRPGDRLLVSTPNITHPHSRLKMFLRGAPYIFGPRHYYQPGHITILPDWMLTEHVRLAGFDDDPGDHGRQHRVLRRPAAWCTASRRCC